ncbi:MAG TPA: hypothetical protein VLJ86_11455 [Ramlibacter sp.]|nr:hypothetical protein [Ramlibacter sp.]
MMARAELTKLQALWVAHRDDMVQVQRGLMTQADGSARVPTISERVQCILAQYEDALGGLVGAPITEPGDAHALYTQFSVALKDEESRDNASPESEKIQNLRLLRSRLPKDLAIVIEHDAPPLN